MASRAAVLMVFLTLGVADAAANGNARAHRAFLAADGKMRPELVAKTLASVEDEWKAQAALFADCNLTAGSVSLVNCREAPGSFAKSCSTVVTAVVQGSSGDRDVAKEYMGNVCEQSVISGWHKLRCSNLAAAIDRAMTADDYSNRESLDSTRLCTGFWSTFLDEEQKRAAQEQAERAAQEKKAAEEAAAAAKKAEEEAKAKADAEEKKAAEEAEEQRKKEEAEEKQRKEDEVKRNAEEAKKKAAEAAALSAQKKAEAEAVAQAAQEKLAEAAKAEEEHKKLQEEHQKAVLRLMNATQDVNATNATKVEKVVKEETKAPVEKAPVVAAANASKPVAAVNGTAAVAAKTEEKKKFFF